MGIVHHSTPSESYRLRRHYLVFGLIYFVAFLDAIIDSCTHSTIVSNRLV